ncbi:hypothetical protein KP509_12G043700 [Ceratopteris richardii]|nr:hypothetical protein KP509_12G043700 [Ceratopteris richardii]
MYHQYKYSPARVKEITIKLNKKWNIDWRPQQRKYRFLCTWSFPHSNKQFCLLCLILHKGIWTGSKARQYKIDAGKCFHSGQLEDMDHLFFQCKPVQRYWNFLTWCCTTMGIKTPGSRDILLGEANGMDILLSQWIRSHIMWFFWKHRNLKLFSKDNKDFYFPFQVALRRTVNQIKIMSKDSPTCEQDESIRIARNYPCNKWRAKLFHINPLNRSFMTQLIEWYTDAQLM